MAGVSNMSDDTLGLVRREGERFYKALGKELYLNRAGFETGCETAEVLKQFGDFGETGLFRSVYESVSDNCNNKPDVLPSFLARSYISSRGACLTDYILRSEAGETIDREHLKIPYRASRVRIHGERKKKTRDRIEGGRAEFLKSMEKAYLERLDITMQCASDLGFKSALEMDASLEGYSVETLTGEALAFLVDTEYAAEEHLKWYFDKRIGMEIREADVNDLLYLMHSFDLKALFLKKDLMTLARSVSGDMALVPEAVIRLDSMKRKGKSEDPLCFPLEPARNIYISCYPSGGISEYASFFGILGQAMSYAHTREEEEFEFRYLREKALTRFFSRILGNLVYDPAWIKKHLGTEASNDALRMLNLHDLLSARLDAALFIYQSAVFGGADRKALPSCYTDIMKSALRCAPFEHNYITGIDFDLLYPARLKALALWPGLSRYLTETFDEQWWRSPGAGEFLKSLYKEGGHISLEDILKKTGHGKNACASSLKKHYENLLG